MFNLTVSGHLVADPRTNTVNGSDVTNFTIINNGRKGGEDIATSVDCAVWGKKAEVAAKYLKKGSLVVVAGEGHVETYEGKSGPGAKIALNVNSFDLPPKPKGDDL